MPDQVLRWCAECAKSHHGATPPAGKMCEDCGLKAKNFGLPGEKCRWCGTCAEKYPSAIHRRKNGRGGRGQGRGGRGRGRGGRGGRAGAQGGSRAGRGRGQRAQAATVSATEVDAVVRASNSGQGWEAAEHAAKA
eukprot:COSAG04_NODE_4206_length_2234_cov_25.062295_4_plen_134_part_01